MSDITIAVASSVAALAMSLVIAGRFTTEVVRALSYGAMTMFGAHVLGVAIVAPIASKSADILGIGAFIWLIAATLAVCIRGVRRSFGGKWTALIVSFPPNSGDSG
jgi:hypothetical protein